MTSGPPPPKSDQMIWYNGAPKPRYRILVRWIDGERTFYPQYRGWFFWRDYTDPKGGRIFFNDIHAASDWVAMEREMARTRARANANPRKAYVAMTFDE